MFTVTEPAQAQVAEVLKQNEAKPIRLFLTSGCGGAQLALAFDEIKDGDETFTINGVDYVAEASLIKDAQPVVVDFGPSGFAITSSLKLGGGCSGCGSTGSCCS